MLWIKVEVKNRNLRKALEEIIRSLEGFGIQESGSKRADLLIFELGDDIEKEFQIIHSLLSMNAVGEVFLISRDSNPAVLLKALRVGAKEFFPQPISEGEIRQSLEKFKERTQRSEDQGQVKAGQIINVMGSKGGVGTTTVAVNLAMSLAEMKDVHSVALVDINMLFGEIPLFLGIKPGYHWGEITKNIDRLDATFLMNILSKHPSGVYVLPSPSYLNGREAATPSVMENILGLLRSIFDFIVIDSGQGLDEISLKILEISDKVLLITVLSLPCLANTNKLLRSFYDLSYPPRERVEVIVNRFLKNSEITLQEAERGIDKGIFWSIPNDYRTTISAINQGRTLSQIALKAPITKSVRQLAYALSGRGASKDDKGWRLLKRAYLS